MSLHDSFLGKALVAHWACERLFLVWILSCFCGFHFVVKPLSHTVHVNGFSPVSFMIFSCLCRVSFRVKPFSHIAHVNGFSPVGILSCLWISCFRVKPLSHTAHMNDFSPVWILSLSCRCSRYRVKPLSHTEHVNGFSPVWTLSCIFIDFDINVQLAFLQCVHVSVGCHFR